MLKDLKIIWNYLKKYRKRVYIIMTIALVGAIISAFIPYLFGRVIDLTVKKDISLIETYAFIVFWFLLNLTAQFLNRYVDKRGSLVGMEASNNFVYQISSYLLDLQMSFHKKEKMGQILSIIYRARDYLEMIIVDVVLSLLPQFFSVTIGIVIISLVEWRLSLMLVLILIIYSIITIKNTEPITKGQKKLMKQLDDSYGDMHDSIINIQVVKSNTNENKEKLQFKNKLGEIIKTYSIFIGLWVNLSFWQQTIFGLGMVLILSFSILLLRQGILSPGSIVMFIGYINLVQGPFGRLSNNYREFKRGMAAIKRSEKIFKEEPEKYNFENAVELEDMKGEIEFKDVSFDYPEQKGILKKVSFKVNPGEVIALVGESGGGKTTVIDLISHYFSPSKGEILIDGHDIKNVKLESLRKNIAIVPQEITLFNDTIKNNIRYGNFKAKDEEIKKAAQAANVEEFILRFPKKYNQIVGERGIKLSTGQKQRVAIARAVLRDPKILILDEATSNLDSVSEKLVQEALKKLIKNRTTFIIAHRLSTIAHADKIFVIDKGGIAEQGKHQDLLLQKGIYHRLFSLQSMLIE